MRPTITSEKISLNPDQMNEERAAWANLAMRAFVDATGTDLEDALCDLLADLMHWSDQHNFDFDLALDHGRDHYRAETAEV